MIEGGYRCSQRVLSDVGLGTLVAVAIVRQMGGSLRDVVLNARGEEAYESAGAERSSDNEFRYRQSFECWGTSCEGESGRPQWIGGARLCA